MGAGRVRGAPPLAAGQRVHPRVVPAAAALHQNLPQVRVPDPQRDRQHLDAPGGLGGDFHRRRQLLGGKRGNGHFRQVPGYAWLGVGSRVLPHVRPVPRPLLPLRTGVRLQRRDGLLRHHPHHDLQLPALGLLPVQGKPLLPARVHVGDPGGGDFVPVRVPKQQVRGHAVPHHKVVSLLPAGPQRLRPACPLAHGPGLPPGPPGVVLPAAAVQRRRGDRLQLPVAGEVVSRQVRPLVPQPPGVPRVRGGGVVDVLRGRAEGAAGER